ncbi:hypothetical protein C0J52_24930, partial [Blattella germanica]
NHSVKTDWEFEYLIILNKDRKHQCLVCLQALSVLKEYNFKRHYIANHEKKYNDHSRESRKILCDSIISVIDSSPYFSLDIDECILIYCIRYVPFICYTKLQRGRPYLELLMAHWKNMVGSKSCNVYVRITRGVGNNNEKLMFLAFRVSFIKKLYNLNL